MLRIPVYLLETEMPHEEMQKWFKYFEVRPFEWRNDDRVAKELLVKGHIKDPTKAFPTLRPIYHPSSRSDSDRFDVENFKTSVFFSKMQSATGGAKIPL